MVILTKTAVTISYSWTIYTPRNIKSLEIIISESTENFDKKILIKILIMHVRLEKKLKQVIALDLLRQKTINCNKLVNSIYLVIGIVS